jgi:F0F1-type ATP synthase membrane subunit a
MLLSVVTVSFLYDQQFIVKGLAIVPFLLRPCVILLGTLVSIVQAAVFTILAMVYVALAIETHESRPAPAKRVE